MIIETAVENPKSRKPLVSQQIVEQARTGDGEAFSQIFTAYQPFVLRIIGFYMGASQAADGVTQRADLAQEVFLKAYAGIGSTRPNLQIGPWLGRITRNCCTDWARHHSIETRLFTTPEDEPVAPDDPAAEVLQGETNRAVAAVLDQLPHRRGSTLRLRYWGGLRLANIAQLQECSVPAVKAVLHDAKRAFATRWQSTQEAA